MSRFTEVIERLAATIESRRDADPAASWTARLLADPQKAAKKLGEEGVEAALAAAIDDKAGLAAESADVLYHLLVALASRGVSLDAVAEALALREGRSGIDEKKSRG